MATDKQQEVSPVDVVWVVPELALFGVLFDGVIGLILHSSA